MSGCMLVICTFSEESEATRITAAVVEQKLAACAHVLPAGLSRYWWQGKIETGREFYAILKTTENTFTALERAIKAMHSYETPCIVGLPVTAGHEPFLAWLRATVAEAAG